MIFEKVQIGTATLYRANARDASEHVLSDSLLANSRFGYRLCRHSDDAQLRYLTTPAQDALPFLHGAPVSNIAHSFLNLSLYNHLHHGFFHFYSLGAVLRKCLQSHVAGSRNFGISRALMNEIARFLCHHNRINISKGGLFEIFLDCVLSRKVQQDDRSDFLKYQVLFSVDYLKRCM